MILFVTCFAIAGSRVSLTGGLYAYVEVAFGKYIGFLAGVLYFLTALGAVAGIVNVLADSVALVIPFLGGSAMRIIVMLAVYGVLVFINIRGVREGAGAVTTITIAKLLPLLLFIGAGIFFIHPQNLTFTWDHPAAEVIWPDAMVGVGGFFFERAGQAIPPPSGDRCPVVRRAQHTSYRFRRCSMSRARLRST